MSLVGEKKRTKNARPTGAVCGKVWGVRVGVQQLGLKGYSYVLLIDTVENAATRVSSLPRKDLTKHIISCSFI